MSDMPLRASEAARRLGISTKDLLRLVHNGEIAHVMRDGIAHIPEHAIDQYQASSA